VVSVATEVRGSYYRLEVPWKSGDASLDPMEYSLMVGHLIQVKLHRNKLTLIQSHNMRILGIRFNFLTVFFRTFSLISPCGASNGFTEEPLDLCITNSWKHLSFLEM
jgi:hypothetical protein